MAKQQAEGWRGAWAAATAVLAAAAATPAMGEICDLRVYDSAFGVRGDEADKVFERNEQFIVCFTPLNDGFVSLWDRIPQDGPVERLGPSPKFEKGKARRVTANEPLCFGDGAVEPGAQGYVLLMEAADGLGLGRMWLVFSETLDAHPDETVFDSASLFRNSYERYGAGAEAAPSIDEADRQDPPDASGCAAAASLNYFYRVVGDGESSR